MEIQLFAIIKKAWHYPLHFFQNNSDFGTKGVVIFSDFCGEMENISNKFGKPRVWLMINKWSTKLMSFNTNISIFIVLYI